MRDEWARELGASVPRKRFFKPWLAVACGKGLPTRLLCVIGTVHEGAGMRTSREAPGFAASAVGETFQRLVNADDVFGVFRYENMGPKIRPEWRPKAVPVTTFLLKSSHIST